MSMYFDDYCGVMKCVSSREVGEKNARIVKVSSCISSQRWLFCFG